MTPRIPQHGVRKGCPSCGTKGKPVKAITIHSLLKPNVLRLLEKSQHRFCTNPACETVYFSEKGERSFGKSDLIVRVGLKETNSPRNVCYCFDHTIEEVEHEIAETGNSQIPESIKQKCRQGLDRCEETNPKGSCCLGDVLRIVKEAQHSFDGSAHAFGPIGGDGIESSLDCCVVEPESDKPARSHAPGTGRWATVGTLLAAVLSSACCWLPLLLISVGVSGAAISSTLDQYRPLFATITFAFLGAAFYFTYRPNLRALLGIKNSDAETCRAITSEEVDCCTFSSGGKRFSTGKFNKAILWVVTAVALAFVFFPNYVGILLGGSRAVSESQEGRKVVFRVEGMSCEGCAATVARVIEKVPSVSGVEVSLENGEAVVGIPMTASFSTDLISKAADDAGFKAIVIGLKNDRQTVGANNTDERR